MARDRQQSELRLLEAVGRILATAGFEGLGVNAVAREAGVDKVLIYRYFGGLPNLLRAYGESGDFWPSIEEVLGGEAAALHGLPLEQRLERVTVGLLDALRKRPQTVEILAWEAVEQNALTETLAGIRERWSERIIHDVLADATSDNRDLLALANVLVAGLQYLMIRPRHTPVYGGLELRQERGWQRIRGAIRHACRPCSMRSRMSR